MKISTSPTRSRTSKKRTSTDADRARKIAFQELYNRAVEESKAAQAKRRAKKYEPWQGAARRFKGLSERLRLQTELRNITLDDGGYGVSFMRRGETFKRYFAGLTEERLSAAVRFRDEALKVLGGTRSQSIPPRVLQALGLSVPVPGIARNAPASAYVVRCKDMDGSKKSRNFSFAHLAEEDAYAAAIEFLEEIHRE